MNSDTCTLHVIDLVGNCSFDLESYLDSISSTRLDNCTVCDVYHSHWHDCYGRSIEKIDSTLEGATCMDDECIYWHYHDS